MLGISSRGFLSPPYYVFGNLSVLSIYSEVLAWVHFCPEQWSMSKPKSYMSELEKYLQGQLDYLQTVNCPLIFIPYTTIPVILKMYTSYVHI